MRYLGIDIGSSFIKGAILDPVAMRLVHSERVRFPKPVGGLHASFREFRPPEIVVATRSLLGRLLQYAPDAAGVVMCSQLHGFVLTGDDGCAASNFISWQDQRALMAMPCGDGTYFDEVNRRITSDERRQLGNEPLPGVPLTLLFWLAYHARLPSQRTTVASLPNFVIANLCGDTPKSDITHAGGHGAFNIETLDWHHAVIEKLGLHGVRWPEIVAHGTVVGEWHASTGKLPFFTPVGDFHCSQLGTLLAEDDLSVNISTGSAVIRLANGCETGDFQTRPWFDGRFLKTITHIPAGRALNALVRLLSQLGESQGARLRDPWDYILAEAERVQTSDLAVDPAFYFSSMGRHGSITNLREDNMTVGHLFRSTFAAMADNYASCAERISPRRDWREIVFSGGVAMKTPVLRQLICDRLGGEHRLAPFAEDTLFGLLVLSLAFSERVTTIQDAVQAAREALPCDRRDSTVR